ncbi:hypothetical protein [Evansella clarkii]|uniref:hypothetical protein n=1 Tax=Evansella clarkii TaxID=79879 RepID=UPI000B44B771|nr:hypothetical protein [Evansella clarkii]
MPFNIPPSRIRGFDVKIVKEDEDWEPEWSDSDPEEITARAHGLIEEGYYREAYYEDSHTEHYEYEEDNEYWDESI